MLQHYILPQVLLLLSEFAKDHQMRVKHLAHAGKTWEMGCDDNPRKGNCCSVVTLPIQSNAIDKKRNEKLFSCEKMEETIFVKDQPGYLDAQINIKIKIKNEEREKLLVIIITDSILQFPKKHGNSFPNSIEDTPCSP